MAVEDDLFDPSAPFEDLVLGNDLKGVKSCNYFYPHLQRGRKASLDEVAACCICLSWIYNDKDSVPDP